LCCCYLLPYTTLFRSLEVECLGQLKLLFVHVGKDALPGAVGVNDQSFIDLFQLAHCSGSRQTDPGLSQLDLQDGEQQERKMTVRSEEHTSELQSRENL